MNYLDVALITVIAVFTIRGLFRGLITELMILVALALGFIIASVFYTDVQDWLISLFPSLPQPLAKIIAFAFLFILVNIVVRLVTRMLNKIATFTFLQPLNKSAGALFGFCKVLLLISIAIIVVEFIPGSDFVLNKVGKKESVVYPYARKFAPFLYHVVTGKRFANKSINTVIPPGLSLPDSTEKQLIKKIKK